MDSVTIWKNMVSQYSHRKLAYAKGKLVAILGLAKRFAKPVDRYLAGLWESAFIDQLEWTVTAKRQPLRRPEPLWRAPSWSWAAVNDPICHYGIPDDLRSLSFLDHHALFATILHCKVVPKTTDEYGELVLGRLQLLGQYTSGKWTVQPEYRASYNYVLFLCGYEHFF